MPFGLTAAAKLLLEGSRVFRGHHHADLKPCDAPHQEEYNSSHWNCTFSQFQFEKFWTLVLMVSLSPWLQGLPGSNYLVSWLFWASWLLGLVSSHFGTNSFAQLRKASFQFGSMNSTSSSCVEHPFVPAEN